jgi:hypothetical protein
MYWNHFNFKEKISNSDFLEWRKIFLVKRKNQFSRHPRKIKESGSKNIFLLQKKQQKK